MGLFDLGWILRIVNVMDFFLQVLFLFFLRRHWWM